MCIRKYLRMFSDENKKQAGILIPACVEQLMVRLGVGESETNQSEDYEDKAEQKQCVATIGNPSREPFTAITGEACIYAIASAGRRDKGNVLVQTK